MKLFTKSIDEQLFKQYPMGADLANQKVVAKIFNPYGRGTWYIINSDPSDPDYVWAIVDLFEVEVGSVSRMDLETIKVPPFRLGLERDTSFEPKNAQEVYRGLLAGKQYAEGGETEGGENKEMLENQTKSIQHHAKELEEVLSKTKGVEPWVITKAQRAATDLADITHYLEGESSEKMASGGSIPNNYVSKTPKEIWNEWDKSQKRHFLEDHADDIKNAGYSPKGSWKSIAENQSWEQLNDAVKEKLTEHISEGQYAKGGVTYVGDYKTDDKPYYFRRYNNAIGAFGWVYEKKYNEGILYSLSDFDKEYYSHVKLKNGEHLFRYRTDIMIKGYQYLIKINLDKSLLYFMSDTNSEDDKNPVFDTRGIKAEYITVQRDTYARGGKLDVGRYYKTKDGRQVRYLGDSTDPELGTFMNKADGVFKVRYDEIEGQDSLFAEGGEIKWQDVYRGDSALVVSENKLGLVVKPYGRKFHLRFPDGTEKTYDASELKFIKDEDEYAKGGRLMGKGDAVIYDDETHFITEKNGVVGLVNMKQGAWGSNIPFIPLSKIDVSKEVTDMYGEKVKIPNNFESDAMASGGMMAKGGEISVKVGDKVKSKSGIEGEVYESTGTFFKLKDKYGNKGQKFYSTRDFKHSEIKSMASGGMMEKGAEVDGIDMNEIESSAKYYTDESKWSTPPTISKFEDEIREKEELKKKLDNKEISPSKIIGSGFKSQYARKLAYKWLNERILIAKRAIEILKEKESKMAKGGKVKFADKVESVKKSLLERKKVPKVVQKDYGKTFSPAEAEDSAKRIVGAQTARERLIARMKSKKKK